MQLSDVKGELNFQDDLVVKVHTNCLELPISGQEISRLGLSRVGVQHVQQGRESTMTLWSELEMMWKHP